MREAPEKYIVREAPEKYIVREAPEKYIVRRAPKKKYIYILCVEHPQNILWSRIREIVHIARLEMCL